MGWIISDNEYAELWQSIENNEGYMTKYLLSAALKRARKVKVEDIRKATLTWIPDTEKEEDDNSSPQETP